MDSIRFRRLHRVSGAILGSFVLAHMVNNLMALAGAAAHRQLLDALRIVYRFPPMEALLIACVLVQVVSGMRMLRQGWGNWRDRKRRAQLLSGAGLAYFLLAHVSAVMIARGVMGIDTDLKFAIGGYYPDSVFRMLLVPHYLVGLVSLVVHVNCALRRERCLSPAAI
ncbi:hypothetical protein GM658_26815 [Pseudoduganella eburnea]|uniref:DUF4405 domain-containing protein n=1 Tax=Massilia eburnea TaxID=1776165 RepID=A0A6L6QPD3_9BURK|nr:hypothetical protein [Massilia eburnea]MTW14232.1 hypothetical protein [Massilia eburnea]